MSMSRLVTKRLNKWIYMNRYNVMFITCIVVLCGYFGILMGLGEGRTAAPVVVLPNDLSVMSKYEGDPSLLSAYVRNDSLILNYEGY